MARVCVCTCVCYQPTNDNQFSELASRTGCSAALENVRRSWCRRFNNKYYRRFCQVCECVFGILKCRDNGRHGLKRNYVSSPNQISSGGLSRHDLTTVRHRACSVFVRFAANRLDLGLGRHRRDFGLIRARTGLTLRLTSSGGFCSAGLWFSWVLIAD